MDDGALAYANKAEAATTSKLKLAKLKARIESCTRSMSW
jgi:hypothetical protein